MFSTLKVRLPVALVGLAIASSAAMGCIAWFGAVDGLRTAAIEKLMLAADSRKETLDLTARRIAADAVGLAETAIVASSMADLADNLAANPAEFEKTKAYFAAGTDQEKLARDGADAKTTYGMRHAKVHGVVTTAMSRGGYADALLLDPDGRVIYSTRKGGEFALKIDDPLLASSGLAALYRRMKDGGNEAAFQDFGDYAPAPGAPSAFIGHPVSRRSNAAMNAAQEVIRVGYVVFRIAPSSFDAVLTSRTGLGETGQIYAVGADGKLRSTAPATATPAGSDGAALGTQALVEDGAAVSAFHDGSEYLALAAPVDVLGATWRLVAEQTVAESLAAVGAMTRTMLATAALIAVATVLIGVLVASSITRPIVRLTSALRALATGRRDTEIAGQARRDEIGEIACAVVQIREMTEREAVERAEAEEAERIAREEERRRLTADMAREFEDRIGSVVVKVAEAAVELERAAGEMARVSDEARDRSETVANASMAASGDVRSVAAASDQLFASIREVSHLIERSGRIAGDADQHAQSTNTVVESLSETARRIGTVVDIIQSIAEQTNLLALNATIEAARAGDAGRGFAVVAGEVKSLAGQTARATEEIGAQISAMRDATTTAVEAIGRIRGVVGEISAAVGSVASAVEEQSAATSEIARAAQDAASGTNTVTVNISDVRAAVGTTDEAAARVVDRARSLGEDAAELRAGMRRFIERILAA